MTISILNDALLLRSQPPEKLQEYLHSINVTIFDPIFHNNAKLEEAKQTVLFILTGYSEDSPLLILRQDSKEEKEGICEYLGIPEYMRRKLMDLSDPDTRKATTQYVTQFAGTLFRTLVFLRIQYNDIELDITNRSSVIKKTEIVDNKEVITESFDSKEHGKALTEFIRLGKAIREIEKTMSQQLKRLEGIEELKEFTRDGRGSGKIGKARTGNPENKI